jgi:asparagine synthase (glutamine-hydrolysing)
MCGIGFILNYGKLKFVNYINKLDKIRHRGPDNTNWESIDDKILMYFHRLSIINSKQESNQPIKIGNIYLICNGEIYNHQELKDEYKFENTTGSDCEVIIRLYQKLPLDQVYNKLDGEFAFILYDHDKDLVYIGRDKFGVRPLFIGYQDDVIVLASEMKAITFIGNIKQYPSNTWSYIQNNTHTMINYELKSHIQYYDEYTIKNNIKKLLTDAVNKRVSNTDKNIGVFLSGGLDSSLITGLVNKNIKNFDIFSVGLVDSVDVKYAIKVTDFLKLSDRHHILYITIDDAFDVLDELIYQLETYCVTTIRASIGQYLLSKFIRENYDIKVMLSGEGSDELFSGYRYNLSCTSNEELIQDELKRLKDIHFYDGLRADRTVSRFGLELRVPFLDNKLVEYVLNVDPQLKRCSNEVIEKKILRDAFNADNLLPKDVLYRRKVAFSDGVSSKNVCLYKELAERINNIISDEELLHNEYEYNKPKTKEALYYRKIFEKYYINKSNIIPYIWMPSWQDQHLVDPSATALTNYIEYDN